MIKAEHLPPTLARPALKQFEIIYLFLQYLLPPLHRQMRSHLMQLAAGRRWQMEVLDVGGRKSHYTIGVPAWITISDLPRASALQQQLHLGINDDIIAQTQRRRSNVRQMVFDDMARSALPAQAFDCVIAVEVLEHVVADEDFVRHVRRVLKPGGCFLMSTPNGDFVKNTNPDHQRHYTRAQLHTLLARHFPQVEVAYAIRGGTWRRLGLRSWSPQRPLQTALSIIGNVVNSWQSARAALPEQPRGTHHLIALARR